MGHSLCIRRDGKTLSVPLAESEGSFAFGGDLDVPGSLTVGGAATVGGALAVQGNIASSGQVQGATLRSTGAATVGGALSVTGASTLSGTINGYAKILQPVPGSYSSSSGVTHYFLLGQIQTPSSSAANGSYAWACAGRLMLSRRGGHGAFLFLEFAGGYSYSHETTFIHNRNFYKSRGSNSQDTWLCNSVTLYYSGSYWLGYRIRFPHEATDYQKMALVDFAAGLPSAGLSFVYSGVSSVSTSYASGWSV